jgi:hypothetical protein
MIEIISYLRSPDGVFTRVDDVFVAPEDPRYVEGAIELSINGKSILDTAIWDYVDQLWAYISDMVLALESHGQAETYFPDQPIKLSFVRQGKGRVLVTLAFNGETTVASADESELVMALRDRGSAFFRKMTDLLPMNGDGYADALGRLADLYRVSYLVLGSEARHHIRKTFFIATRRTSLPLSFR